jgi:Esterase/lipase
VLIYRLPHDGSAQYRQQAFADTQRALRLIRANAQQYQVAPDRIGVMGFSAGAFLAANLSNTPDEANYQAVDAQDKVSARPDFSALIYPVLSLKQGVTHPARARRCTEKISLPNKWRSFRRKIASAHTRRRLFWCRR